MGVDDPAGEGHVGAGREGGAGGLGDAGEDFPPWTGIIGVRRLAPSRGANGRSEAIFPARCRNCEAVNEPRAGLARRGLACVVVGAAHTELSWARAACTDRPALLKDEGSDSCPRGVSS